MDNVQKSFLYWGIVTLVGFALTSVLITIPFAGGTLVSPFWGAVTVIGLLLTYVINDKHSKGNMKIFWIWAVLLLGGIILNDLALFANVAALSITVSLEFWVIIMTLGYFLSAAVSSWDKDLLIAMSACLLGLIVLLVTGISNTQVLIAGIITGIVGGAPLIWMALK